MPWSILPNRLIAILVFAYEILWRNSDRVPFNTIMLYLGNHTR